MINSTVTITTTFQEFAKISFIYRNHEYSFSLFLTLFNKKKLFKKIQIFCYNVTHIGLGFRDDCTVCFLIFFILCNVNLFLSMPDLNNRRIWRVSDHLSVGLNLSRGSNSNMVGSS